MKKRGPKSLADRLGEETISIKVLLTKRQHKYLLNQPISASAVVRSLVEGAIEWEIAERAGADLSHWDLRRQSDAHLRKEIEAGRLAPGVDWDKWYDSYVTLLGIEEEE